ncbi:transport protein Trs120 or TRAPPC9 TRAPP II complex subunit-domain-containing protein [Dactylonectria macrodidyma]|uniref:Transport protein Trs120 or TRAPPC9 TRAPP II complex subunit-domain-containing protein n=1 Tax=Dactylonectria macrodidyma TaxID=307937 RepID=A0A9P9JJU0_9HYPO|nr:transport protein Trs120 or TRAPPC9 TRAPP II complex subunit-domain-containing protein [Dactylonectria macrodidyma]
MADSATSAATHNSPRNWLLTSALSPLAVRLIRQLLAHGDYVIACLPPLEIDHPDRSAEFRELINECKSNRKDREGWKDRIRGIRCNGAVMSSCGAAIAEAIHVFGRIDILLCCTSEAVVGTVEELSTSPFTQNLVRDQFETIFFSQVNFIKATLPKLRSQHTGHIIVVSSTGGHIGTPGMSMYTAATWALEGYCDSLAYEIAPFNIKVTIVQPNKEIQSLTNKLIFAPQMAVYEQGVESVPSVRDMLTNVLNTHPDTALPPPSTPESIGNTPLSPSSAALEPDVVPGEILHRYPKLPPGAADKLVLETVHALMAIGGHENPPARHIVGHEGALSVKEKLKTVTEELEDFVEASLSVDIFDSELQAEARDGHPMEESPADHVEQHQPNARMILDPLLPVAPARVKALLLPLGQIKADRFAALVERLNQEHVVHLRDVTADGRPNRNMFSPLAYPDGAIIYDLVTHVPPPSHLALTPFDLYREPLAIIALADGTELDQETFSKRNSANGTGPTTIEKNIRALYQELEDLRDNYPRALAHQVLVFDYVAPPDTEIPIPEGIMAIPPTEDCKTTTMKTVLCNVSSLLLAEMTTLAKSFEAMTTIESPGHYLGSRHTNGSSWGGDGSVNGVSRRNSQFSLPQARSSSVGGIMDKHNARMSMPATSRPQLHSSQSTPGRPSTPVKSSLSNSPLNSDTIHSPESDPTSTPDTIASRPDTAEGVREISRDRVSVQGFGPGGANERWRLKGKGRVSIVIGSMYLQAGRWSDSLKELMEGATAARSLNDHVWHGKALELILVNLLLLGWSNLEFQIPAVCYAPQDRPSSIGSKAELEGDPDQPKHLKHLQTILPDLMDRILALYSRISAENLPTLPLAETYIRFAKILSAVHLSGGKLNKTSLDIMVLGLTSDQTLPSTPRYLVSPTRQQIVTMLFKAFPSSASDLLTTVDRAAILSSIATILGPLGLHRKKAMVIRELVSVLIGGLVEARTRGAADMGIHPAAGLVSLAAGGGSGTGAMALDLGDADVEQGIEALLGLLCRSYGIVGFDMARKVTLGSAQEIDDSDEAVIARILGQSSARFFGFPDVKLNILRACINFSEALPDFNGALKFSSDLLRTAGSGVAPGPRREDASPIIHRDEQVRLATNISRTSNLSKRLGLSLSAEYWDEFLVRSIKLEPPAITRTPIVHAKSVLPGATASRASQDVDPFIYNPFLKKPDEAVSDNLVAGEIATFKITLQNPYDIEVEVEKIEVATEGVEFEPISDATVIGPYRTQVLRLRGRPKAAGDIKIIGAVIKVRGCRERRFPIFSAPWTPTRDDKVKAKGIAALDESVATVKPFARTLVSETLNLKVIQEQPLVVVKATTLAQSSIMILEGERKIFSVTLQNLSTTPVDFLLFSFKDSTQEPLQAALANRDATPAELYEYELILMKKQALRLPRGVQGRNIAPGGEATFDFEIFGKPGLTSAMIQVDYTHLGCPRDEIKEEFYTRQVSVNLTVTVNASVEVARIDALALFGEIPRPIWDRLGSPVAVKPDDYCLVSVDLRNAWPSQIAIRLESDDGVAVEDDILPGNTTRLVLPVKRVYLEDPHATIPTLNPSRNRQFVVSTSKISPEMERANREAFWYRERILDCLKATWRTTCLPKRSGTIDLRNIRLTSRMIEAIKVDEVGIEISVHDTEDSNAERNVAYVDEFTTLKVRVTNRTAKPIYPVVRILPALCHRPANVALEFTRKFAWNGTLQQLIPELKGHGSAEVSVGVTALCRGEFEVTASVEEVQVWEDVAAAERAQGRPRSETQSMMDAALGVKQRRMWHARQPCMLTVRDRE